MSIPFEPRIGSIYPEPPKYQKNENQKNDIRLANKIIDLIGEKDVFEASYPIPYLGEAEGEPDHPTAPQEEKGLPTGAFQEIEGATSDSEGTSAPSAPRLGLEERYAPSASAPESHEILDTTGPQDNPSTAYPQQYIPVAEGRCLYVPVAQEPTQPTSVMNDATGRLPRAEKAGKVVAKTAAALAAKALVTTARVTAAVTIAAGKALAAATVTLAPFAATAALNTARVTLAAVVTAGEALGTATVILAPLVATAAVATARVTATAAVAAGGALETAAVTLAPLAATAAVTTARVTTTAAVATGKALGNATVALAPLAATAVVTTARVAATAAVATGKVLGNAAVTLAYSIPQKAEEVSRWTGLHAPLAAKASLNTERETSTAAVTAGEALRTAPVAVTQPVAQFASHALRGSQNNPKKRQSLKLLTPSEDKLPNKTKKQIAIENRIERLYRRCLELELKQGESERKEMAFVAVPTVVGFLLAGAPGLITLGLMGLLSSKTSHAVSQTFSDYQSRGKESKAIQAKIRHLSLLLGKKAPPMRDLFQ